eukprot:5817854-Prorocentrum_lima.AAC.1
MGLFSVIIGTFADCVARRFPAAIIDVITAYADDIIVVCDAEQAEAIYSYIQERLQNVGIELNLGKLRSGRRTRTVSLARPYASA